MRFEQCLAVNSVCEDLLVGGVAGLSVDSVCSQRYLLFKTLPDPLTHPREVVLVWLTVGWIQTFTSLPLDWELKYIAGIKPA